MQTRTQSIRALKAGIIILVVAVIVSYAVWRSLPYARGPAIVVFQPVDGSTAASSTIDIIGRADRVNSLTIDGQAISLDRQGDFKDTLAVFLGTNLITLEASDQFGRTIEKRLEIVR